MGRPLNPQRKAQVVGGSRREGGGWGMTDRRQEQSYIQVRPTFHQSKTIHSILCKSLRLNARFRSQVWRLVRRMQTRWLENLSARWTQSAIQGHGSGYHLGESALEMHSIFVLFVNTSG